MSLEANNASPDCLSVTNEELYLDNSEVVASFETIPEPVIMGDLWGYISDVNQATVKLFGAKDKTEFIGKHVLNFVVKDDRSRAVENSLDSIKRKEGRIERYSAVLKNGKVITLCVKTAFLVDNQGERIGFIDFIRPE
jgi:PAS domain S-box-containing protein